jgi:hypothetical protein
MAIRKLKSPDDKNNVVSTENELAGVVPGPAEKGGPKPLPDTSWKSPQQLLAEQILSSWFGKK